MKRISAFILLCAALFFVQCGVTSISPGITEKPSPKETIPPLFELLESRDHEPENFVSELSKSRKLSDDEARNIVPDSLLEAGDSYFLSSGHFVTSQPENTKFTIYYRRHHNVRTEKRLRAEIAGKSRDLMLAMSEDNDTDYDIAATTFINDSLFIDKRLHTVAIADESEMMVNRCDSVISTYRYDNTLNLLLLRRDTIRFFEEQKFAGGILKTSSKTLKSKNFTVNGADCYWNFVTTRNYSVRADKSRRADSFTLQLVKKSNNTVILADTDLIKPADIDNLDLRTENFRDVNFDGYIDFINYSYQDSGSGGAFYKTYIYDPKLKAFSYCNDYSGGELETDAAKRTLSMYWKTGFPSNTTRIIYFGDKGKIKYTEDIVRELRPGDAQEQVMTTYTKRIGNKVVKQTVEMTAFED